MNLVHVIGAARAASEKAYAPYSNFRVGAAVLTEGGAVYAGCNVENASYGLATCAERNAIAAMTLADPYDRKVRLIAIVSPNAAPCFPCGACRQVLHEFGCEDVVVFEATGGSRRYALNTLLPHAFGPEYL
ncbi:MAG: cytidine deaminase [Actinomycetota bacterium]|nr:cytidine deaminase [Actinomycetota bacterium]